MTLALVVAIVLAIVVTYFIARSRFGSGVAVTYVDAASGDVLKRSFVQPWHLPETFAITITVTLDGVRRRVVRAEPMAKTEFAKTRALRIELAPATAPDAAGAELDTPTLSRELGEIVGNNLPDPTHYQLHEHDWRQRELVSSSHADLVRDELADIRAVLAERREGGGFPRVHGRTRITDPLSDRPLTLAAVEALLPVEERYAAVGFARHRGTVRGGFAWKSGELVVWGVTDDQQRVTRLCLGREPAVLDGEPRLAELARVHDLVLVDWPAAQSWPALG
jgi:hypothetical protein